MNSARAAALCRVIFNSMPIENQEERDALWFAIQKIEKDVEQQDIKEKFDIFWSEYPNKKAKGYAFKAFKRINPDDELLKTMLRSIAASKRTEQWKKDNNKYIPHPATWLNGECWQDELEIIQEKSKPISERKILT